ncbi:MAG: hypothetical protein IIA45_13195 [Bacteroidetes bacterium]|nr:hypothetical protein [Bacteroidota bacterium]
MKKLIYTLCLLLLLCACKEENTDSRSTQTKNEVIVIGTIHGKHVRSKKYSIEVLKNLLRSFKPDLILAEIPPDRIEAAMIEFLEYDTITEPRVAIFPEYVKVVFPLTKEMDFEIIATAGWTKEMADKRRAQLTAIRTDSLRRGDWLEFRRASAKSDSLIRAGGNDDPYWIHTDEYDEAVEVWASTYNRLFNEELGSGGWDNINSSHYEYIAKALDDHQNQGLRIVVMYGSGHKGWFLRKLREREDIILGEVAPFLDQISN